MSTPHPYTDERITLPATADSPNPELTNTMRELIANYADDRYACKFRTPSSEFNKILCTDHYNPVTTEFQTTTPWGNILTATPTNTTTQFAHRSVIKNCHAVGYHVLNNPTSTDPIKIFQPASRRYHHFNSPHRDAANADIFIINYITNPAAEHHNIALAGSNSTLRSIASEFIFDSFRPQHGHVYLTDDISVTTVKNTLDTHTLNYTVHTDHTSRTPLHESFNSTTHNTVITQYSTDDWATQYAYHKYNPDTHKACCGTLSATHTNARIVTEETAHNALKNKPCQRASCHLNSTTQSPQQTL